MNQSWIIHYKARCLQPMLIITCYRDGTGGFVRRSPFLIRVEVDAMIKKEKEKAYATFGLDLKPSYLVEILPKLYPTWHFISIPEVLTKEKEIEKDIILLCEIEGCEHPSMWCISSLQCEHTGRIIILSTRILYNFSRILYTPGTWIWRQDLSTIRSTYSLCSIWSYLRTEAKFMLAELGRTRCVQDTPGSYVTRFHQRALNCCYLIFSENHWGTLKNS